MPNGGPFGTDDGQFWFIGIDDSDVDEQVSMVDSTGDRYETPVAFILIREK